EAATAAGLWDELATDWLLLDCELLPWSANADTLIQQFAAVGAAGRAALPAALSVVAAAAERGLDLGDLRARLSGGLADADAFTAAYRQYVHPTDGLDGVTLAPFAVLASASGTHADRDHGWHLTLADRLVAAAPQTFTATRRLVADTGSAEDVDRVTRWWLALTADGGEGMVVKPFSGPAASGSKGLHQPGLKCRGREYLRIIYGPGYAEPRRLDRLRGRNLGRKRGLALREHALGLAALEAAGSNGPLWRVHELVFAILASESEPVDPRL
ncbi:MAG: polynucleotide kinase-phosphatase, partial [Hamadaea sp.]|nr:polynucleotide kinase-phosphatase [Hamadaea sp.]